MFCYYVLAVYSKSHFVRSVSQTTLLCCNFPCGPLRAGGGVQYIGAWQGPVRERQSDDRAGSALRSDWTERVSSTRTRRRRMITTALTETVGFISDASCVWLMRDQVDLVER